MKFSLKRGDIVGKIDRDMQTEKLLTVSVFIVLYQLACIPGG